MYRYVCQHCGAHLDPGENCDCMEKEREQRKSNNTWKKLRPNYKTGQFELVLDENKTAMR